MNPQPTEHTLHTRVSMYTCGVCVCVLYIDNTQAYLQYTLAVKYRGLTRTDTDHTINQLRTLRLTKALPSFDQQRIQSNTKVSDTTTFVHLINTLMKVDAYMYIHTQSNEKFNTFESVQTPHNTSPYSNVHLASLY